jgi:mRNA-degrading endonuclease RelE of RelBE toxin-antitoxin system
MNGPYELRVEAGARAFLEAQGDETKADFVALFEELCLDPRPHRTGGVRWREVKIFARLRERRVPARIFKALEIQDWRVFFFVHEKRNIILIKEIVPRTQDTYEDEALCQRLKDNYDQNLKGELR